MNTPVFDFLRGYQREGMSRFHMPGHKGAGSLGCESWDLTEIMGADSLYEAEGIIAQAEENTAALFGSGGSLWSTEGSSQCIRAMLYLAVTYRRPGTASVVLAARNVHKSFVYAAALVGFPAVAVLQLDKRGFAHDAAAHYAAGNADLTGLGGIVVEIFQYLVGVAGNRVFGCRIGVDAHVAHGLEAVAADYFLLAQFKYIHIVFCVVVSLLFVWCHIALTHSALRGVGRFLPVCCILYMCAHPAIKLQN